MHGPRSVKRLQTGSTKEGVGRKAYAPVAPLSPCFSRWGRPPGGGEVWRGRRGVRLWKQGAQTKVEG